MEPNLPINKMTKMGKSAMLRALSRKAHYDLEYLQELASSLERTLREEGKRLDEKAGIKLSEVSDEYDRQMSAEDYAEDIYKVTADFPRILRYALFVNSMSMIEASIVSLIRAAKRIFNITENFNEQTPDVIARGIKFLQDNVRIDTSHYQYYVEMIDILRVVRNCITHSEGNLKDREADDAKVKVRKAKDAKAIREYAAKNPKIIEEDQYNHLTLQPDFIEIATNEMLTLLDRLHESVARKMNESGLTIRASKIVK